MIKRVRAGYYTGMVNGRSIEIEYAENAIEDGRGWVLWIDGRNGGIEYPTLQADKLAAQ